MADPCEKTIEWRHYRRGSDVRIEPHTLMKRPPMAPAPKKTFAEMASELAAKIDAKSRDLNSHAYTECAPCAYLGEEPARTISTIRSESLVWDETFELRDARGDTISGTARYRVNGVVTIETEVHVKRCGPVLGDDPDSFMVRADGISLGLERVNWLSEPPLATLWAGLEPKDRRGLEFTPARKKR
ncbi:MAG: hypothetical protein IPL47_13240 [Phyllobacteriaceae bacterium]|nr:hypothetical protein [Phyllobacteriaceae bacterium]